MKRSPHITIQAVLFTVMGILTAALLIYLWVTPNIDTWHSRELPGCEQVQNISFREVRDPDSPTGIARQFSFRLDDELSYDTTLIFRFSHQTAYVELDGEPVYSLTTSDRLSMVRTTGSNWAMIPLHREDAGKEIRVVLTPVYQNYQHQTIEFMVGSKLAAYTNQFRISLPEIVLSLLDILAGLALLCAAVYFSFRSSKSPTFYALALLAISLGLWNFTQTDFAPLIMPQKTVFLYYTSLTMLMLCVIPLIKSVKPPKKKRMAQILDAWCVICGVASVAQLALQIFGVWDLREMLKVTHGMIAVSSLILIVRAFVEWRGRARGGETDGGRIGGIWLLGVGALLDMAVYYFTNAQILFFVLLAIFCYVLNEGLHIFVAYVRQKQLLEEKDTQLTLSRITIMMSQIRSHFVFNILNAISGMCKYDPEKADETVVRFSRYLRNNIDIMEDDKPILFSVELVHLEDYVELEQVRFGDRIEFYTDVKTDQFMIPPLILQPVVENAIKHGLTKKQGGGSVILRTWEDGENIKISVEDDGVGFEPSALDKAHSVGLRNIRYRLQHLAHGTLDIQSQPNVGTTVTITIPKKESEPCTSFM